MMFETEVFLSVYSMTENEAHVPVQSALCLFILRYLQYPVQVSITLVLNNDEINDNSNIIILLKGFSYRVISSSNLKHPVVDCRLPVFSNNDGISCVAGFCAVLRQIIKHSGEEWSWLLGFRKACLAACAEVSLWTKFCEVDIISTVESVVKSQDKYLNNFEIPKDVARFEEHLNQDVRVHNIKKILQETEQEVLSHSFAESHQMSLADIIIYPCMFVIVHKIGLSSLESLTPSVYRWYTLVSNQDHVLDSISIFKLSSYLIDDSNFNYIKPDVLMQSLYKSDPKRYRPKSKLFTRQEEVSYILSSVNGMQYPFEYSLRPYGHDVEFDWNSMPNDVKPSVPQSRLERKIQQLENLAKAVLKIAVPGDTIIDFCCGSGHLGILVAYCLPNCHVILIDNKEESLSRARIRVNELGLNNIHIIQCNLDYFDGSFQLGMSLHACGVATDLVINTCIKQNAKFIVCPCCYGSLQDNHKINYPQSKWLKDLEVTNHDFIVLGHCADQVHKQIYKKTEQGEKCMAIVDYDRCLLAKDTGYNITLAKLVPPSCTPRNNLLVGFPEIM